MKNSQARWIAMVAACAALFAASSCSKKEDKISLPEATAESNASVEGEADGAAPEQAPMVGADEEEGARGSDAAPSGRRFSGAFEPRRTSKVAANVGGIVRRVYVDEGQAVEEGDRLVDIDSQDYRLRVQQAEAQLAAAQAQVDMLETEYERVEELLAKEAVAPSEVDQLSGNLAAARANAAQAKVGVRMARKAQSDALIRAPFGGVVTMVSVEQGDFAAPGPQPLVQIEQVGELLLRAQIPEEYAATVSVGDTLVVQVPATSTTLEVPVTRINPVVTNASRSFDVLAEVENGELQVRPGMFAKVTLAGPKPGGDQ
jgi:RND family efflux transporter MFP subunit